MIVISFCDVNYFLLITKYFQYIFSASNKRFLLLAKCGGEMKFIELAKKVYELVDWSWTVGSDNCTSLSNQPSAYFFIKSKLICTLYCSYFMLFVAANELLFSFSNSKSSWFIQFFLPARQLSEVIW